MEKIRMSRFEKALGKLTIVVGEHSFQITPRMGDNDVLGKILAEYQKSNNQPHPV